MGTAAVKNYNSRLPVYEKLFVFSCMGGAVILTEFPPVLDMLPYKLVHAMSIFKIGVFL